MPSEQPAPVSIDEYIATFPPDVQQILRQVRAAIRDAAPDAEETISYQIPTFTLNGRHLVYFAGYGKHVAVYPAPVANPDFAAEMAIYGSGKGTVKFPLDRPIPFDLIRKIVKFRNGETRARADAKRKK
jgi:uncharacterized protein YdhG (YjbR/CyaY superfamily)